MSKTWNNRNDRLSCFLRNNKDRFLSLAICFILSYQAFILFINYITNYLFFGQRGSPVDTLIIYLFVFLCFATILTYSLFFGKRKPWCLIAFFLIAYGTTYAFFPSNRQFMYTKALDIAGNPIYSLFLFNMLSYLAVRNISDFSVFEHYLEKFSYVVVLMGVSHYIVPTHVRTIYMTFSYNILLQATFLMLLFIKRGGYHRLIVSVLGYVMIFWGGARGSLIVGLVVPLLYFLHYGNVSRRTKSLIMLTGVFALLATFLTPLISMLESLAGSNSRTISMLASGEFFVSSERLKIYQSTIAGTGLLGKGLFADRIVSHSVYAHNIVLEILVQFGWLIGSIVLGLMFYLLYMGLRNRNASIGLLCYACMTTGFLKLMLSGSFLREEPAFYVLLALSVTSLESEKGRSRSKLAFRKQEGGTL